MSTPAIHDSEAGVLGGILLRNEVLASLPDLEVEHFHSPRHQTVFAAMRTLETRGEPVDVITLEVEIERVGKLSSLGGVAFLGELALRVPTPDNAIAYAAIVRDAGIRRRLQIALSEVLDEAKKGEMTAEQLLSLAQGAVTELDRSQPTDAITVGEVASGRVAQVRDLLAARERGEIGLSGIPTGVTNLDAKIGGWQPGVVNLLAARPGMGKSSLAMAGAAAASHAGYGVHYFCQEDSQEAHGDRLLARQSGIPAETIRNADITTGAQMGELLRALTHYQGRHGWLIDFTGGLTAEQLIRRVRRHLRTNGTRVVFVDYVQLVRKRDERQNDNDAWAEIMTQFAMAAKQDGIAWVVLSQLNRKLEERPNKRPQLQDLRGSGGLEERARIVATLYRGSVYQAEPKSREDHPCTFTTPCNPHDENCPHRPTRDEWKQLAEVNVVKNNNGRTGRVWAKWEGAVTRLS